MKESKSRNVFQTCSPLRNRSMKAMSFEPITRRKYKIFLESRGTGKKKKKKERKR